MIILMSIIISLNVFTYQNEEAKFDDEQKNIFIYFHDPYCHQCAVNLSTLLKYEKVNIIYYLRNLEDYRAKASIVSDLNKMFNNKEIFFTNTDSDKINKNNPFVEITFNGKSKIFQYKEIFQDDVLNSFKKEFIKSLKEDYGLKLNENSK